MTVPDLSVREVIARALAQDRQVGMNGDPAIDANGRVQVEFRDDADAVLAALTDQGVVLAKEQVGWWNGFEFDYPGLPSKVIEDMELRPVYVPLTDAELRGES